MHLSLRRRLVLSTAGAVAVLVLGFAVAILLAVSAHLLGLAGTSAQGLALRVREVAEGKVAADPDAPPGDLSRAMALPSLLREFTSPMDPQVWVLQGGRVVAASPNAAQARPGALPPGLHLGRAVWRATSGPATGLRAVVDWPLGADLDLLRDLLWVLLLGGLATAAVGAAVSRWATHRVLDPVDRMTAATEGMLARGVPARMPPLPGAPDEFTRLADLLSRLTRLMEERRLRERRLLAEAAHQLRTPLAILSGNLHLVEDWAGSEPEVRQESVAVMRRTVEEMDRLVGQLLVLERAAAGWSGNRERVDLAQVARELAEDAQALHPELEVSGPPAEAPACWASLDPVALRRAAWAVLENALAYTPAGGRVRLGAEADGEGVWLRVEDSGPGIPEAERERVWERFYRGRGSQGRPGSGLGLPIARALVEAQDGQVELECPPEGGTRVTFRWRGA